MLRKLTGQNLGCTETGAWILLSELEVAEVHDTLAVPTEEFG